jgi:signal transduction histidine kinase
VLELSRAIHDSVLQRLSAASMALADVDGLDPQDRRRAAEQVTTALGELRELLVAATRGLEGDDERDEAGHEPAGVVLSVMAEVLANIRKHASLGHVSIHLSHDSGGLDIEVVNDVTESLVNDVAERSLADSGVGLRLAELQLRSVGGELESGPATGDRWRVRVHLPALV